MHLQSTKRAALLTAALAVASGAVLTAAAPGASAQDIRRGSGPGSSSSPSRTSPRPRAEVRTAPPRVRLEAAPRVSANPNLIPAVAAEHFKKANDLFDGNKLEGAIGEYEKAIQAHAKFADAWVGLGNTYYDLANLDEAVDAWKRALAIDSTIYQAHANLANVSYVRRDYETAVKEYKFVIDTKPNYPEPLFGMGNALVGLRRYDEAVPYFDRALQAKNGVFPEASLSLAQIHLRLKNPAEAERHARKGIADMGSADDTQKAQAWGLLGAILYDKADLPGAVEAFNKSIGLCKSCAPEEQSQTYYNLSLAYESLGKRTDAAGALEQYLRLAPYVTNAQDVRERIARLRGGDGK